MLAMIDDWTLQAKVLAQYTLLQEYFGGHHGVGSGRDVAERTQEEADRLDALVWGAPEINKLLLASCKTGKGVVADA